MDPSDRLPKHLLIGFLLALGLYAAFFAGDQWTRSRKGPWEVRFTTNAQGEASIVVSQPKLGIADVSVTFGGEAATNFGEVRFDVLQQFLEDSNSEWSHKGEAATPSPTP